MNDDANARRSEVRRLIEGRTSDADQEAGRWVCDRCGATFDSASARREHGGGVHGNFSLRRDQPVPDRPIIKQARQRQSGRPPLADR